MENAWPALVSRETFDLVQQGLHERAPARQRPARVGSQYLLSGLLRGGVCGKPYSAQGAKSGQFAYYVCSSLFREGAGACTARYLNATKVEDPGNPEGQGADSHRGDHHRAGAHGGRGDRQPGR